MTPILSYSLIYPSYSSVFCKDQYTIDVSKVGHIFGVTQKDQQVYLWFHMLRPTHGFMDLGAQLHVMSHPSFLGGPDWYKLLAHVLTTYYIDFKEFISVLYVKYAKET